MRRWGLCGQLAAALCGVGGCASWPGVRQAFSFAAGERSKIDFVARGKLAGSAFGGVRFESKGEFDLPAAALRRTAPGRH